MIEATLGHSAVSSPLSFGRCGAAMSTRESQKRKFPKQMDNKMSPLPIPLPDRAHKHPTANRSARLMAAETNYIRCVFVYGPIHVPNQNVYLSTELTQITSIRRYWDVRHVAHQITMQLNNSIRKP